MPLNLALIGVGLVGSELLAQLQALPHTAPFRLAAVAGTRGMVLGDALSFASPYASELRKSPLDSTYRETDLNVLASHLRSLPGSAVVVDCTASAGVADLYPTWLRMGLSVVTANKKGFAGPSSLFREIYDIAERTPKNEGDVPAAFVYHESSVGAGLPVISTLRDLVRTGDKIKKIEGVFSGTLSYIFNTFSPAGGSPGTALPAFSDVVKIAKEKGFTEPDPRDDLNGMDVARKVTILARVAGKDHLELSSLQVESLVPQELRDVESADEFLKQLTKFDGEFARKSDEATKRGEVLRYIGIVDLEGNSSGVKLVSYPPSHPFAGLTGSDNIVAFTTERFPNPLVIRGAGAGSAVTSFGVMADLFKVHERTMWRK